MNRVGLFTDVHANLPALEKCIDRFSELNCDVIYHLGDLVGIGPYPLECLELATSQDRMRFVMGNHDHWYAYGLPQPTPDYMHTDEVEHHIWTHQQIGDKFKEEVSQWPFQIMLPLGKNSKIALQHYALNSQKNWFKGFLKNPVPSGLDTLYHEVIADVVFYGHDHNACDMSGKMRYVNLGSAGCCHLAEARIGILEIEDGHFSLRKESLQYDDTDLLNAFDERNVPARDFIRKVFIPREAHK